MANIKEKVKKNTLKFLARYPRVAFIHVPKCAGVSVYISIYAALYPSFSKALPLTEYIDLNASKKCKTLLGFSMMQAPKEAVFEKAMSNLSNFESVGFLGDLQNWNKKLSALFGKKIPYESRNASPNNQRFEKIKNTPSLYSEISKLCALDIDIYNESVERFKS